MKTVIGTAEWADEAERAEWQFVANTIGEAIERMKPTNMSVWRVAQQVAQARAKEGWRSFVPKVVVNTVDEKSTLSEKPSDRMLEIKQAMDKTVFGSNSSWQIYKSNSITGGIKYHLGVRTHSIAGNAEHDLVIEISREEVDLLVNRKFNGHHIWQYF